MIIFNMIRNIIRRSVGRPFLDLAAHWHSTIAFRMFILTNFIHIDVEEMKIIVSSLKSRAPCEFLVFGLGNDSVFWTKINRGGQTVFLEDNQYWLNKITKENQFISAYLVVYETQMSRWRELFESPDLLNMTLPEEIIKKKWDVILVDAPEGWTDLSPGRMKSIFMASRLIKNSGDVFVHDCDRQVEEAYCDRYLKQENLKTSVKRLRYYHCIRSS